jgi:hypothetical protein
MKPAGYASVSHSPNSAPEGPAWVVLEIQGQNSTVLWEIHDIKKMLCGKAVSTEVTNWGRLLRRDGKERGFEGCAEVGYVEKENGKWRTVKMSQGRAVRENLWHKGQAGGPQMPVSV